MTDKVLIQIQTILILLGIILIFSSVSMYIQWGEVFSIKFIETYILLVFGTIKNALNCAGIAMVGAILIIAGVNIK